MLKSFKWPKLKSVGIVTLPVTVNNQVYNKGFQIVDIENSSKCSWHWKLPKTETESNPQKTYYTL